MTPPRILMLGIDWTALDRAQELGIETTVVTDHAQLYAAPRRVPGGTRTGGEQA